MSHHHVVVAVLAAACAGGRPGSGQPPPASPPPAPPAPDRSSPAPDAGVTPTLTDADCAAFGAAPVLALATVRSATPDCSSVGHTRVVLDVLRLARGARVAVVSVSYALHEQGAPRLSPGDHVVIAVEPRPLPAEDVYCVPMPARDGAVMRAIRVDSGGAGDRLLDDLGGGAACAP